MTGKRKTIKQFIAFTSYLLLCGGMMLCSAEALAGTDTISGYHLIHEKEYSADGVLQNSTDYKYDNHLCVKSFHTHLGDISTEYSYSYDEEGRKAKEVITQPDGTIKSLLYEYSEDGTVATAYMIDKDGEKVLDHNVYYDIWGNCLGSSNDYMLTVYDRYGTEITNINMGWAGVVHQKIVPGVNTLYTDSGDLLYFSGLSFSEGFCNYAFCYDSQGRIVSCTDKSLFDLSQSVITDVTNFEYYEDGSFIRTTYSHDETLPLSHENGIYIICEYSSNGIISKRTDKNYNQDVIDEYFYDDNGQLLLWLSYNNGIVTEMERNDISYDENGCIVEIIKYVQGEKQSMIVREYEKYKKVD